MSERLSWTLPSPKHFKESHHQYGESKTPYEKTEVTVIQQTQVNKTIENKAFEEEGKPNSNVSSSLIENNPPIHPSNPRFNITSSRSFKGRQALLPSSGIPEISMKEMSSSIIQQEEVELNSFFFQILTFLKKNSLDKRI